VEQGGMVVRGLVFYLDSVGGLAFSKDGRTLLTQTHNKGVRLWEVATGLQRLVLRASRDDAWSLALAPDGLAIASGAWDGSVRLWDTVTGNQLFCSPGHRGIVTRIAFSADGRLVASAGDDTTALVWDVQRLVSLTRPGKGTFGAEHIAALWAD